MCRVAGFSYGFVLGCVFCGLLVLAGCPPKPHPTDFSFASADPAARNGVDDVLGGEDLAPGYSEDSQSAREVIEPDVIRQDGSLLYILNQYRGLAIVDMDEQRLLSRVPAYGLPRDLYLVGNRAYVLVAYARDYTEQDGQVSMSVGSRLFVVDISDPADASVAGVYDLEGDLADSRLVGDVLYAVSAHMEYWWAPGEGDVGGAVTARKAQTSESWVTSVNVADPENIELAGQLSFAGFGDIIQATASAIFVAANNWSSDTATITYIDISDPGGRIAVRGSVQVPGQIADRFKMDVWQGVLRVVSGTNWSDRQVMVTTVDLANPDALQVLASMTLEDAAGETLFATRFDGPLAYIVTYFIVDPLFVVDLSDPSNPRVTGELEVPGWSTHIEPRGDRLIALGVDDTAGRQVSVSLFDVGDTANPQLVERVTLSGDWSWSTAYGDVKALTVLDEVIIVPFSGWNESGPYDRLQFLSYSRDSLTERGTVDVQGAVLRSFQRGDAYYGVTTEQLATIDGSDLDAPEVVHELALAEYVADYHELGASAGLEVILRYGTRTVSVRAAAYDGTPLDEVAFQLDTFEASFLRGATLVVAGSSWEDGGRYDVVFVDCTQPEALAVTGRLEVEVTPWYGGWWWGGPEGGIRPVDAAGKQYMPHIPYLSQGEAVLRAGDMLVLRCQAEEYDRVLGPEAPEQGLALVDLEAAAWAGTAGLGYAAVSGVHAEGSYVYVSTKDRAGTDNADRWMCAYFVSRFDPAAHTMGPRANVPGRFLAYDRAEGILLLEDFQYGEEWHVVRAVNSVSWDGVSEAVAPLDDWNVPERAGQLMARGRRVFYEGYREAGSFIGLAEADTDGGFGAPMEARVSEDWAWLFEVNGADAYVSIGGNALIRYDFSGELPAFDGLFPLMGYPLRLRFGAYGVYAPLGYAGLGALPL